jgi:hypothetical protein
MWIIYQYDPLELITHDSIQGLHWLSDNLRFFCPSLYYVGGNNGRELFVNLNQGRARFSKTDDARIM